MSSASASEMPAQMQMRGARASAVIVHHVPPEQKERFLEAEHEITKAVEGFPGYQATEIYPPSIAGSDEWVVLVHFGDQASLQKWIDSPIRRNCIEKMTKEVGKFKLKTLPSGFGAWFAGLTADDNHAPAPGWKMAATVLLCLYPIVMLLQLIVGPYTAPLGLAFGMLIGNFMSVCILQWAVMPIATNLLGPWLKANDISQRAVSIGGLIGILMLIGIVALAFRAVAG